MTNVLAIDQGTSSTKALVVSDGGKVLGEGSAPVHPEAGAQGAVEQDPEELFQSIVDAGRAARRGRRRLPQLRPDRATAVRSDCHLL